MHYDQQADPRYRSNRVPALFACNDPVWYDDVEWIVPHFDCQSERDAMLDNICCGFLRVPFESQGINFKRQLYAQICKFARTKGSISDNVRIPDAVAEFQKLQCEIVKGQATPVDPRRIARSSPNHPIALTSPRCFTNGSKSRSLNNSA